MTPAASLLQPDSNPALYVAAVLTLYVDLPDTPLRASVSGPTARPPGSMTRRPAASSGDRFASWPPSAACWRPPTCHPLPRSARWPTSNQSSRNSRNIPSPDGYLEYLRLKLRSIMDKPSGRIPKIYVFR